MNIEKKSYRTIMFIIYAGLFFHTVYSFSQELEYKPVESQLPEYLRDSTRGKLEFINTSTSAFRIILDDTVRYYKNNLPYTGIDSIFTEDAITLDDPKNIFLFVISYKNGYKTKVEEFYPTGAKYEEINFDKGIRNGDWSSWYENGQKNSISFFFKGNMLSMLCYDKKGNVRNFSSRTKEENDILVNWYEDGKVSYVILPICDGKPGAVEATQYYKNGSLKEKVVGNNGRQLWEAYFENGQKQFEAYIVDAEWAPVGRMTRWYENGQKEREWFFKDGETQREGNYRIGTWSWWDEKGNLTKQEIYENDVLKETKEFMPPQKNKNQ